MRIRYTMSNIPRTMLTTSLAKATSLTSKELLDHPGVTRVRDITGRTKRRVVTKLPFVLAINER